MSRNILLTKINTEIEKLENLVSAGHLDDVRRTRLSNHGEQLQNLKKHLSSEVREISAIEKDFLKLKESAEQI